jgi:hypothetical protein
MMLFFRSELRSLEKRFCSRSFSGASPKSSHMHSYLCILVGTVLLILALTVTCNVLVDPYRMSGVTLLQRWAGLKPRFGDNHVLGKPFVIRQRQPRALILGTSRENHALDPNHPAWPAGARTYNLAMDAANMADLERLFEHARHVSALEEVVIALDFLNMFDAATHGADNFDASLLVNDAHSAVATWFNAARYFASWPMLRDSVHTLREQDPARNEFETDGRRNGVVFERAAGRFGQHHMFEFSERRYLSARLPLPPAQRYVPRDAAGPTLRHLARLLDRAADAHIRVHLYVTPVHARQLEVYRTLGLWDALEQWKRSLRNTALGHELRRTSSGFELWDFADYSSLTTEPVPEAGNLQARMQWYWESSHYKKSLGDQVLNRIFGIASASVPGDFGVRLDRQSDAEFEQHLQNIRAHGAAFRNQHPRDVADLQRLAAEIRRP